MTTVQFLSAKVAVNSSAQVSRNASITLGYVFRIELLGHIVNICSVSNFQTFPQKLLHHQ